MDIRLRRLELRNFKGVAAFTLEPGGGDVTIRGQNGAGKSSVADALNWLLFDKNQTGEKTFSIKTIGTDGQSLHDLEHGVAGTFRLEPEGRELTLEKILREKWTKKRGSGEREFQGHETAYAVDGVPRKKGEFDEAVAALCPEEPFRLLTSTTYFNALRWQDRRRILLDVSGDVTDAEVIEAHEGLAGVAEILGGRTLDDAMKVLKARRPKINSAIDQIPARIDEVQRSKPEAGAASPPAGGKSYNEIKAEWQAAQERRAAILAGDNTEVRARIADLQDQLRKAKGEAEEAERQERMMAADAAADVRRLQVDVAGLEAELAGKDALIKKIEASLVGLREKWTVIDAQTYTHGKCALCNRPLPEEMNKEMEARFNAAKAEELKACVAEGEEAKTMKEARAAERARIEQQIATAREEIASKAYTEAPEKVEGMDVDPLVEEIEEELLELQNQAAKASTPSTEQVDKEIEEARAAMEAMDQFAANVKRAGDAEARMKELQAEKKALGLELDEIERSLSLLEEFTRAKVAMLTSAVEKRFAPLSFRLFQEQVNGGLAETCETLVPSPAGAPVPWGDANTGARVLAGLQIIRVLAEHYGVTAPVFIDNAESLTDALSPQPSQRIRLIADAACPELTLELDEPILQAS
jgi:DNA repair exonuclease SbcCD ATPase subunit